MEYGSIFGHGAYLGPDYTADYLHRAADIGRATSYGGAGSDSRARADDRRLPGEPLRRARPTRSTYTAAAGGGLRRARAPLRRLLLATRRPSTACARMRSTTRRRSAADGILRLVGLGGGARRPGHNYSYTNNWPPEELVDNGPTANVVALERRLADRAARRDRPAVRSVRALELPRLARPRAGDALVPPARRRRADARAARVRLVLPRDGGPVPDPDDGRRGLTALPGRARRLLRHRPRPAAALQPRPHLPRPARDLLRLDLLPRRRDLPRADDRRTRAEAAALARLRAARSARHRRLRQHDRRVRRRPRLVRRGRLDLRHPGLRVPRPRPLLAGPAGDRAVLLGGDHLPRRCAGACSASSRATCRGSSSSPRSRSRRSTRSACSPARATPSRSPTSGASGSSTSGSRTSSSCSRP